MISHRTPDMAGLLIFIVFAKQKEILQCHVCSRRDRIQFSILVLVLPFLAGPTVKEVSDVAGSDVKLECDIVGYPIKFEWRDEDDKLINGILLVFNIFLF